MERFKYPRTPHLPWSLGTTDDDKILNNIDHFIGKEVVVTLKMDGENTTIYNDYIHARSIDSNNHLSRDWIKAKAVHFQYLIPDGWRICGENLFAVHSIAYTGLKSYFYLFSVWNQNNTAITWDETVQFADKFNIPYVPVLYRGIFDETIIKSLYNKTFCGNEMEGYVVRLVNSFQYNDFAQSVAKYVRPNHIKSNNHWMNQEVIRNSIG